MRDVGQRRLLSLLADGKSEALSWKPVWYNSRYIGPVMKAGAVMEGSCPDEPASRCYAHDAALCRGRGAL